jgi:hypothetical protein
MKKEQKIYLARLLLFPFRPHNRAARGESSPNRLFAMPKVFSGLIVLTNRVNCVNQNGYANAVQGSSSRHKSLFLNPCGLADCVLRRSYQK